jgi:Trypsin
MKGTTMKNSIQQKRTITQHNDSFHGLPWRRCILLLVLGGVLAALSSVFANDGAFDIDELSVDEENRFSNVGAFIVAVVDDSGNLAGLRAHCSGVLIHRRVFLTAGHCVGPGEFGVPPNVKLFVSLGADALDQSTWLAVTRVVPPPLPSPLPRSSGL